MTTRIGRRMKARREELGLSQEQMARRMSFNHRQTLAAIENGRRNVQPAELAAAARILEVDPDYFTDAFLAVGEASFSFRTDGVDPQELAAFELRAGRWLATYRELGEEEGRPASYLVPSLSLSRGSSYEDAQAAADHVRRRLGLGRYPARELEAGLEREWGILVLYVDAPSGVSGAASRLDGLQVMLINRNEPAGRRNYDIAHELFHLMTWDSLPPRRIDSATSARGAGRVEQLANNFAAALLMPESTVRRAWEARKDVPMQDWLAGAAARFGVSGPALKWRVHNLDLISERKLPDDREISLAGRERTAAERPQLFNASFVQRVHAAVESGVLSLRKASSLLGLDSAGFARLCRAYGRQLSYEV